MPNKRILPAAQAVFAGPSPATGHQLFNTQASGNQLHRIQSYSFDFSQALEPVNQLGQLSVLSYEKLNPPTVNFSADWLATNVRNESGIGLFICGSTVSGALARVLLENAGNRNYYVKVVPDGQVAAANAGDTNVYAFGNMNLASYRAQGAVGGFPTASFSAQGLNIRWTNSSVNFDTPAINPADGTNINGFVTLPTPTTGVGGQLAVLKPGDITVDLNGAGLGLSNACVQSYDISTDLSLEPIICLGSKFPSSYEPTFPVNSQASFEVNMRDIGTGNLQLLQCSNQEYNLSITLRAPTCDGSQGAVKVKYTLNGAVLESQNFNTAVGNNNQTVSLSFTAPAGAATENRGLFLSGTID